MRSVRSGVEAPGAFDGVGGGVWATAGLARDNQSSAARLRDTGDMHAPVMGRDIVGDTTAPERPVSPFVPEPEGDVSPVLLRLRPGRCPARTCAACRAGWPGRCPAAAPRRCGF